MDNMQKNDEQQAAPVKDTSLEGCWTSALILPLAFLDVVLIRTVWNIAVTILVPSFVPYLPSMSLSHAVVIDLVLTTGVLLFSPSSLKLFDKPTVPPWRRAFMVRTYIFVSLGICSIFLKLLAGG